MKVEIGPYVYNWSLTKLVEFLVGKPIKYTSDFYEFLEEGFFPATTTNADEKKYTGIAEFIWWLDSKRNYDRKVKVKIDKHDVFNADATLSHIALPLLKKFREELISCAIVDLADVPQHLWPSSEFIESNTWWDDGKIEERWKWVLDEMIYAHSSIINEELEYNEDHEQRVRNGLMLFGKYYQNLWQ